MRPMVVFGVGVLASAVAGAVCSLGFLLVGAFGAGTTSERLGLPSLLLIWVGMALWYGLGAGIALGIVPAGIAAGAWPQLVQSVGEDRAVRRLTVLVTAIVLIELVVAAISLWGVNLIAAVPWVLAATAVCAVIAWLHLRAAQRFAQQHSQRLAEGGRS
ncbi:hypothetical protein H1W00_13625 [Aeromicrobium sp. Marseille-Q0843]|uniref:Uncharacterized protein n=1 Tax=Aeromicrobium phoceense TaxID=2754045 RepID=A0A838XKK3_9ACTN|nr:hypothetical protein [Aeromicrobium phoceense]MBA4609521.1 hypothetical protein [Aeromicrobium phoceense]